MISLNTQKVVSLCLLSYFILSFITIARQVFGCGLRWSKSTKMGQSGSDWIKDLVESEWVGVDQSGSEGVRAHFSTAHFTLYKI